MTNEKPRFKIHQGKFVVVTKGFKQIHIDIPTELMLQQNRDAIYKILVNSKASNFVMHTGTHISKQTLPLDGMVTELLRIGGSGYARNHNTHSWFGGLMGITGKTTTTGMDFTKSRSDALKANSNAKNKIIARRRKLKRQTKHPRGI